MTEVARKNLCYVAIKMIRRKKRLRSGKMFAVTLTKRKVDEARPCKPRGVGVERCRGGHGGTSQGVTAAERGDTEGSCSRSATFFFGGEFPTFSTVRIHYFHNYICEKELILEKGL